MKKEFDEYILPSCYASALVNEDWSGLSDEDEKELDKWLEETKPGHCVMVDEDEWFQHGHDMNRNQGATVMKFYFRKH